MSADSLSSPPPVLRLVLVHQDLLDRHPDSGGTVVENLSKSFKVVIKANLSCDVCVPGKFKEPTIAFNFIFESEVTYPFQRKTVLERLEKMSGAFKIIYWLLMHDTRPGLEYLTYMHSANDFIRKHHIVLCNSPKYASQIIQIFSKLFTKERQENAEEQKQLLDESVHSKSAMIALLMQTGLSEFHCQVVIDCMDTLYNVSQASYETLIQTLPLGADVVRILYDFFHHENATHVPAPVLSMK